MNIFWCALIIISFVFGAVNGKIDETVTAGFNGAAEAIKNVISFAGIMCLWNGFMEASVRCGLCDKIKKLLSPFIRLLFPKLDRESAAVDFISLNVTANLLGTGNGATPVGINAMKELARQCEKKPSEEMCTFAVINTVALQLVPSSIIAIRSAAGSTAPFEIITPIWICSGCAFAAALLAVKILFKFVLKSEKNNE